MRIAGVGLAVLGLALVSFCLSLGLVTYSILIASSLKVKLNFLNLYSNLKALNIKYEKNVQLSGTSLALVEVFLTKQTHSGLFRVAPATKKSSGPIYCKLNDSIGFLVNLSAFLRSTLTLLGSGVFTY